MYSLDWLLKLVFITISFLYNCPPAAALRQDTSIDTEVDDEEDDEDEEEDSGDTDDDDLNSSKEGSENRKYKKTKNILYSHYISHF